MHGLPVHAGFHHFQCPAAAHLPLRGTSEVPVPLNPHILQTLTEQYPPCANIIRAFAPLEEACAALVQSLPAPIAPSTHSAAEDAVLIAQGKPLFMPDKEHVGYYVDTALVAAAPSLCSAAAQGFPQFKEALETLETFLRADPKACAHLITLALTGKHPRVAAWAKKHDQHKEAAQLMASHMARCAARRVARHATQPKAWDKGHCPICGSAAQAGFLRHKEGYRFLHCGLCDHSWRFSRTVCPVCEDTSPEKRKIFHLEGATPQSRAEGCDVCKHYLLVPDMRDMLDEMPLSLLLFGLIPMDMLMQQEGYTPPA